MKKFGFSLLVLLLVFIGLIYWSVSIGPSEVYLSKLVDYENSSEAILRKQKMVKVSASNQYRASGLKKGIQGENYRQAWEVPITAQVLYLDTFEIKEEGGGHQTYSLKIKDPNGILYSLRSINKDPAPIIPEAAKKLNLENIIIDGISAQHPYGAVLTANLADAAAILHTHPKIVYVPSQKKLGDFNKKFGNKLYLLEYETEGKVNWTSFENVFEIIETDDLQELKAELKDNLFIDESALVRARLFDLLIGDWDRHSKQWGWVLQQQGEKLTATPLPGDRDNAFFKINGMLPAILTNRNIQPLVRPFEKDIDYLPGYVYPFDIYFLKQIPEEIFITQARYLQETLTDAAIERALKKWPSELVILNGAEIAEKLKQRRSKLVEYARAFKKEIDKAPYLEEALKGSEDLELPAALINCFECQ